MPSMYKTLTLLKAIQSMPKVNTFLRDTFFPKANDETFVTEEVLLDIKKGKRTMAPFVAPRVGGVTLNREGFKTEKYKAPRLAPQRVMTVDDLSVRGMGENVFSNTTPQQRQAKILASDTKELGEAIDRREEWLSAQVLFEGKALLKGYVDHAQKNFIEQELDFEFDNKALLSGTDLWNTATADIYGDIEKWRKQCIQKSGVAPDTLILGSDAYTAFRENEKIQKMMNMINMQMGLVNPSIVSDAVTFIGRLPGLGLEIYTYDDWYLDDDGTEKPFIPENKVLLAKKAFGGFAYGAVTQMENKQFMTYEGRLVPKTWSDEENDQLMLRLSSRPVPKPGDVNSWFVAEVL